MKLQTIGSTLLFSLLAALSAGDFPFIPSDRAKIPSSQVLAQNSTERKAEADRLLQQGEQQTQTSQFEAAIQSLQQALNIYRELKDRSGEAKTLSHLGIPYALRGDYAKAIEYCQQSLAIAREIADRSTEQGTLTNLGSVYGAIGEYAKAIEYYQQSLAIARETSNRLNEGGLLINLGIIYGTLGDYAKAIEYYQQSLPIVREISSSYGERLALGNLGVAYRNLGDFTKAIEYGQQALAIARQTKDRQGEASVLGDLGTAYNSLGEYAKAIEHLKQSLAIAREVSDRRGEVIALENLGFALYKQGNFLATEQTLFEGIKVLESLRTGLDDNSKVSILDTQVHTYQLLQQVLIVQKKTNEALEIAERGRARAFVELLAARLAPSASDRIAINPPNIQQIQQIAKEQNATLVEYSTIRNEALYIWVIEPTGEIIFRSVDLKSLNINLNAIAEDTRKATASSRGLKEQDTAFADMIRGTRDALGTSAENLSYQPITNHPNSTHANSQTANQKLQKLYQLLIEPIADVLPTNPKDLVIFIPHQSLFLAPFASLQNAQGQYLIEKHTIVIAPAIQVLQLTRQSKQKNRQTSPQNILVVGNPTMPKIGNPPKQLAPLPASEQEAQIIAKLLNTQAIIGSQATKVAITQQISQARIIHLATHGLLNEVKRQDMPGAIALAPSGNDDGLLTSSEILDLNLNAELVVLSACNTGRGTLTGDGVIGLSRAFITAGVPSILASLWYVPDAPTAELMTEFYRQLQQSENKAQALRQAMLITMKKHPNPRDWAAFTLIGEAE